MVTRVKGHEGLASLVSLLMAVTHLQPLDHRVQRLRLGMGWLGGVSMVHLNASLLPFVALKISFSDKDFHLSPAGSPGLERGHGSGAPLLTGCDCRNGVSRHRWWCSHGRGHHCRLAGTSTWDVHPLPSAESGDRAGWRQDQGGGLVCI